MSFDLLPHMSIGVGLQKNKRCCLPSIHQLLWYGQKIEFQLGYCFLSYGRGHEQEVRRKCSGKSLKWKFSNSGHPEKKAFCFQVFDHEPVHLGYLSITVYLEIFVLKIFHELNFHG